MATALMFLCTVAAGGGICAILWVLGQKYIRKRWWCRAPFCLLVGTTIAPAVFPFYGSWALCPAVFLLPAMRHRRTLGHAFLYGALPILLITGVIFIVWSVKFPAKSRLSKYK